MRRGDRTIGDGMKTTMLMAMLLTLGCERHVEVPREEAHARPAEKTNPGAADADAALQMFRTPDCLYWGTPKEEIIKVMTAAGSRMTGDTHPKDGFGDEELQFDGRVFGQKAEQIAVELEKGLLISYAAQLQAEDVRPAARRWLDWVQAAKSRYGRPAALTENPDPETPTLADHHIVTGDWVPQAKWNFAGDSTLMIRVIVGDPNKYGSRLLTPFMMALDNAERVGERDQRKHQ